jgi:general stress protein 26
MSNTEQLKRQKAIKRMQQIIDRLNLCVFCTRLGQVPFASRPMTTLKADDEGALWFFSGADSNKNAEIKTDNHVELLYSNLSNMDFLSIHGRAEILIDPEIAKELWTPIVATWFQHGPDDPELTLIKVTPVLGHYWDDKKNKMVEMLKMSLTQTAGAPAGYANGIEATLSS